MFDFDELEALEADGGPTNGHDCAEKEAKMRVPNVAETKISLHNVVHAPRTLTPNDRLEARGAHRAVCDKCDGPHETNACPFFKGPRDNHKDAFTLYGKAKDVHNSVGDGAPVVRNARVVPQPGDGSCLFHSLAYGLQSDTASALRQEIRRYIEKNPDITIADTTVEEWVKYDSGCNVGAYSQQMAGSSWGGGMEMAALTRMRNVNVHVYEKCAGGFKRISCFEAPNASKTVTVLYQGRMHYDALVLAQ